MDIAVVDLVDFIRQGIAFIHQEQAATA